jgi:hypothetical protein
LRQIDQLKVEVEWLLPSASLRSSSTPIKHQGRVFDDMFIERRLWRTVKYEEVYLKDYANVWEAKRDLKDFFRRYKEERPHSALGNRRLARFTMERPSLQNQHYRRRRDSTLSVPHNCFDNGESLVPRCEKRRPRNGAGS